MGIVGTGTRLTPHFSAVSNTILVIYYWYLQFKKEEKEEEEKEEEQEWSERQQTFPPGKISRLSAASQRLITDDDDSAKMKLGKPSFEKNAFYIKFHKTVTPQSQIRVVESDFKKSNKKSDAQVVLSRI